MGYMDEKYPMWFVYDYYVASGRPKAEDAVMKYAKEKYLYNLVSEAALEDIQMDLEAHCMKVREQNKRLAPVDIHITNKRQRLDGHAWIYIGAQHLCIRRVVNTIDY
jgi:hypothetical protein